MKKRTSSKTLLKPTKYQHFHLSGRSRGPPQTTKITPGAPLDPPQTPSENFTCFRSLPGAPLGTPRGLPGTPPGTPRDPPGTPRDPPGNPNAPQGPPQRPPGTPRGRPGTPGISRSRTSWISRSGSGLPKTSKGPLRESHTAKGPPRDRPLDSARRNARSD